MSYTLTQRDLNRLKAMLRDYESRRIPVGLEELPNWQHVRITGAAVYDGSGSGSSSGGEPYYPGVIIKRETGDDEDIEIGDIWVHDLNGEALTEGTIYSAQQTGNKEVQGTTKNLFVTEASVAGEHAEYIDIDIADCFYLFQADVNDVGTVASIYGAKTPLTNTTTETDLGQTFTIPKEAIIDGTRISGKFIGVMTTDGTPPATLTMRLKLNGSTIASTNAATVTASLTDARWSFEFDFVSWDSSGGDLQSVFRLQTGTKTEDVCPMSNSSTISLGRSGDATINLTAEWSSADAGSSITLRNGYCEAIKPFPA